MQSVRSMRIEAHGLGVSLICGHRMAERCHELHVESAAELGVQRNLSSKPICLSVAAYRSRYSSDI